MKGAQGKTSSVLFSVLTIMSFAACFIFARLGSFIVWISGGATVYFMFMAIYSVASTPRRQFTKKKRDRMDEELKAHIAFHVPIMISMFLVAILIVAVILFFAL